MLEDFKKKRWEGKPLAFKLKYMYANYPGITIGFSCFLILPIIVGGYRYYTFENSRLNAVRKFKIDYMVVRDDDPKVNELIAEKELGRHLFPNY